MAMVPDSELRKPILMLSPDVSTQEVAPAAEVPPVLVPSVLAPHAEVARAVARTAPAARVRRVMNCVTREIPSNPCQGRGDSVHGATLPRHPDLRDAPEWEGFLAGPVSPVFRVPTVIVSLHRRCPAAVEGFTVVPATASYPTT